jgi:UDP-MurNAc hydroxylase
MLDDVRAIGFEDITEIAHGCTIEVSPGFRLTSYHFGPFLDSAVVLDVEGVTLFNVNDAKLMGDPLGQVLDRHARIDFVFRSHSSANARSSYAVVDRPRDEAVDDTGRYVRDFATFAVATRARYAIPFASNHCHLHRDTWEYNAFITTPVAVREYFTQRGITSPELVIMVPGDSWCSSHGFQIAPNDYFTRRTLHLERYREEQRGVLERQDALEATARVDWGVVAEYFGRLRCAVPWPLRRLFRHKPVLYVLTSGDGGTERVEVDLYRGTVRAPDSDSDAEHPRQIHTTTYIFMQCITRGLFSHLAISKRVRYRVTAATRSDVERWNFLFNAYEYDLIPLRNLVSPRFVACAFRRWREAFLYAAIVANRLRGRSLELADYLPLEAPSPTRTSGFGRTSKVVSL